MKSVRNFVEDLNLSDGERFRGKCPLCKRANTFTAINKMGKLLYNCYANSCTISGATNTTMKIVEELYESHRKIPAMIRKGLE